MPSLPPSLRASFLAAMPSELRTRWQTFENLESRLRAIESQAKAAWPSLAVEADSFAAYLGERMSSGSNLEVLDTLHASDLYLTCACVAGEPAAFVAFEAHCAGQCAKGLAKLSLAPSQVDEVQQTLRDRLFVAADSGDQRIRRYSGKGSLRAWYRVTALRVAIDQMRAEHRLQLVGELDDLDARVPLVDPELEFLKNKYRQEFKDCFQDALRDLSCGQRNLLRYQLLEGLTLEQIGAIYRVHLSSIARRLQKTRGVLLECTRRHLQHRLGVDEGELDSIMRLIQSRLDVSISKVLRDSDS